MRYWQELLVIDAGHDLAALGGAWRTDPDPPAVMRDGIRALRSIARRLGFRLPGKLTIREPDIDPASADRIFAGYVAKLRPVVVTTREGAPLDTDSFVGVRYVSTAFTPFAGGEPAPGPVSATRTEGYVDTAAFSTRSDLPPALAALFTDPALARRHPELLDELFDSFVAHCEIIRQRFPDRWPGLLAAVVDHLLQLAFASVLTERQLVPACPDCGRDLGLTPNGRPRTGVCDACRQRDRRANAKPAAVAGGM